jgi:hypothetical protein
VRPLSSRPPLSTEEQSPVLPEIDEGPQDDDALHAYIVEHVGIDVPRTAVCEGHDAPFDALADFYFARTKAAIWLANRGGSKSANAAIVHWLNARFKPGHSTVVVGAVEAQARRVYEHLRSFIRRNDSDVDTTLKSTTHWANGSDIEIVAGTENAVRGLRKNVVHVDEQEMLNEATWRASRLSVGASGGHPAQHLVTSTRAYSASPMDRLVLEQEQAEALGQEPEYHVAKWCLFETTANVPNCGDGCGCDKVVKGQNEDGSPRTFADVCAGKLKRSAGWIPLSDVWTLFRSVGSETWSAEMECTRPATSGLILPTFTRARHGFRGTIDPRIGNVHFACDFGGSDLHAGVWILVPAQDVTVVGLLGESKVLRAGTRVVLDTIYRAEVGIGKFADLVVEREREWRSAWPGFRVVQRWGDTQGKSARLDFIAKGLDVRPASRDVLGTLREIQELVGDGLFAIDLVRGDLACSQLEAWRFGPGGTKPLEGHEKFDDLCDAIRYALFGIKFLERQQGQNMAAVTGASDTPYRPQTATGMTTRRSIPGGYFSAGTGVEAA